MSFSLIKLVLGFDKSHVSFLADVYQIRGKDAKQYICIPSFAQTLPNTSKCADVFQRNQVK